MQIQTATFLTSQTDYRKCPPATKPEYAFIGRSNVGKSSLINAMAGTSKLAHISAKPGKTRTINHFEVNRDWYLVDLPGYGYAKTSKKDRALFSQSTQAYLKHRENLMCTFVLIDSRIPPQKIDLQFMEWMGRASLPFALAFTKIDKLEGEELQEHFTAFTGVFMETWDSLPPHFFTSAEDRRGTAELLAYIAELNQVWKEHR